MKKSKLKKVLLLLLIPVFLFFVFILIFFIGIDPERADDKLSKELLILGKEVKQYKQERGVYPDNILQIRDTAELCVKQLYKRCTQIHYKISADKQDFRMAVKAFSWPVFYYHPEISMTTEEYGLLSQEERDRLTEKYGRICFVCAADLQGPPKSSFPVYRKDPKIFEHPELWPEL